MPKGVPFWTAYRLYYARELLARGESKGLVAERLGCTREQLTRGLYNEDKKAAARG